MKYVQRDGVEVNFMFPDGTFKPHPALIGATVGVKFSRAFALGKQAAKVKTPSADADDTVAD